MYLATRTRVILLFITLERERERACAIVVNEYSATAGFVESSDLAACQIHHRPTRYVAHHNST